MRKTSLVRLLVVGAATMAIAGTSSAESKVVLASGTMTITFSEATGQIESLSDRTGAKIAVSCEDWYDLDGKTSVESVDAVVSMKAEKKRASFECVNKRLGIRISKEYRLDVLILEKETKYLGEKAKKLLFKLASRTQLEPGLYKDGYYYTPTDDGYKAYGVPFIAGTTIKEPMPWTFSTGSFVYYFPRNDQVFTHYRYKVNGHYFYGEVHSSVESKFIPGGAITAVDLGFINDQTALNLETHYALINGDPSDYHRYIFSQPPYTDYQSHKPPTWFSKCRMFISDPGSSAQGLMENRDTVLKDIADFMKLLKDDEYLMVFFEHWTVQGDFPYEGTFRYWDYRANAYSKPVPIERLREALGMVQAISPRIKIGGYATLTPTAGTPPYDEHKDWMIYDRDGHIVYGGDGTGLGGLPGFLQRVPRVSPEPVDP